MNDRIDRLLRSAAHAGAEPLPQMPFGFDTRVLAELRSNPVDGTKSLAMFAQRVAFAALGLIALAVAATYQQLNSADITGEFENAYAIADSAMEAASD